MKGASSGGFFGDVRTQIIAATAVLTFFGYKVLSPQDMVADEIRTVRAEVSVVREAVQRNTGRIDDLAELTAMVEALTRVQCVQAKTDLVRDILKCRQ